MQYPSQSCIVQIKRYGPVREVLAEKLYTGEAFGTEYRIFEVSTKRGNVWIVHVGKRWMLHHPLH